MENQQKESDLEMQQMKFSEQQEIIKPPSSIDTEQRIKIKSIFYYILIVLIIIFILFVFIFIYFLFCRNRKINVAEEKKEIEANPQIKRFKEIVPSFIKSDSKGDLYLNYKNGFKEIPLKNIYYKEDESSTIKFVNREQLIGLESNSDLLGSADISIFHFHSNFNFGVKEILKQTYQSKTLIARYKLGTIYIKKENIALEQTLLDKLNMIANYPSNEDKVKELEEIFESYGFFIPLHIQIGGMLKKEIQEAEELTYYNKSISELELKVDKYANGKLNYTKNEIFKDLFSNKDVFIIGGDKFKETFEEWKETLNLQNADIIGYNNIIDVTQLLDMKLKLKIKEPLKIIREKYNKRKKYYEYLKAARNMVKTGKMRVKGNDIISHGICKIDNNLISVTSQKFDQSWALTSQTKHITISTNENIIVGWKIMTDKPVRGSWTLEDPLLKNEVNIRFVQTFFQSFRPFSKVQSFILELYVLKLPE